MNFKDAKQVISDAQFEPNASLAVGSILDEAERLQKAFALACRFAGNYALCPRVTMNMECQLKETGDQCDRDDEWQCWQKYFLDEVANEQVCRACGCTEDNACVDPITLEPCHWAAEDLCSACAGKEEC